MTFRTKLDYSDNRQIKQRERTNTILSGTTTFGVPFSALTSGPDMSATAQTSQYFGIISTYSGNSATTVFTWSIPNVSAIDSSVSALTPSNSGVSQNISAIFGSSSSTTIDGNLVNLTYSGVGATNLYPITMSEPTPGNYTGTVSTDFFIYSAQSLDFTGRTIWIDNTEILRTKKLIVSDNPQVGYVLTSDSEGLATWQYNGSSSGSTIWSAGTGLNSAVLSNSNIINTVSADTVYAPNLILKQNGSSKLGINMDPDGTIDILTENGKSKFYTLDNISTVQTLAYSGDSGSLTNFSVITPNFGGISLGVVGSSASWPAYGVNGDSFVYSSQASFGLNIVSADGVGTADYIRFYAGLAASNTPSMHIHGTGATKGYVAINGVAPSVHLDVNGNGRFRSIGSGASAGVLNYTADGTLTVSTSDERLKTNVNTIENPLTIIKQMRGVSFNWVGQEESKKYGFIAQELDRVDSNLVFTNHNTEELYMGVHYESVIPVLVEAIKQIVNNDFITTQTILAEDNNIELNYNGDKVSAIGGGISIINGIGNGINAEFILNNSGSWVTNNSLAPISLIIPEYTPETSYDNYGKNGDITRDENYLYVRDNNTWKRSPLQMF
jgi:hypothetical protein